MAEGFIAWPDLEEPAGEAEQEVGLEVLRLPEDLDVPDIVTFVESPEWLARPRLYPRQKTALRLFFLELHMLDDYDLEVIDEWQDGMRGHGDTEGVPGDVLERARILLSQGYDHFREWVWIGGRRSGKNHVGALAIARIIWRLRQAGSPSSCTTST